MYIYIYNACIGGSIIYMLIWVVRRHVFYIHQYALNEQNGQLRWLCLAIKEIAEFEFSTRETLWCYWSIQDGC